MLSKIVVFIRWLLLPEKIVEASSEKRETTLHQKEFPRWIFASEELPRDEAHKIQTLRTSFIRWLISREKLD